MSLTSNSEHEYMVSTIYKEKINDENVEEQLLKIQELDASIHNLGMKIEDLSNKLIDSQIKNRKELRQMISSSSECELLARNTQLFLNLYSSEYVDEKIKKCDTQGFYDSTDDVDNHEQFSMTDEEKQELKKILSNNSSTMELTTNYSDFGTENEVNPYSICVK